MKGDLEPWYAARCVFCHAIGQRLPRRRHLYEERVIILRARSADEAIREAEREAREYARSTGARYLQFVETFHLLEKRVGSGSEVFSLMRSSNRAPDPFLSRYYDDGSEHRQGRSTRAPLVGGLGKGSGPSRKQRAAQR